MSKVFISYSHIDTEIANNLAAILTELNVEYFLDRKDINWGNSITTKVQDGLDECVAILVIVSPASLKSHWVPYEIGQILALRKIVLPFLTHPSLDVPLYISSLNHVTSVEQVREYFTEKFVLEAEDILQTLNQAKEEYPTKKTFTLNLSDMQRDYLMEISRPRNNGNIPVAFLDRPGRNNAKYKEALDLFYQYQLMEFDGSCYNLTTKGWDLADQFWGLRILDSLVVGEFIEDIIIAEKVELTDGETELEELRRIVSILEEKGYVRILSHRGGENVEISKKGVTHRKHKSIMIP